MSLPRFSIIIPVYNDKQRLEQLLNSLSKQTCTDFEVLLVDDHSNDGSYELAKNHDASYPFTLLRTKKNSGPAVARNVGISRASGKILLFTDSDCLLPENWVESYVQIMDKNKDIVTGKVKMLESNVIGNSMSALGFPAGGSLGFDKMWKVQNDGSTVQIVTCNCAIRKKVFDIVGLFDETFPLPFGEDTEMSQRMLEKGYKIYYNRQAFIRHPPRDDIKSFFKWSFRRGRGIYHLKQKVKLDNFIKLRFWSMKNIVANAFKTYKAPVILSLFFVYNVLLQAGHITEMVRPTVKKR